jgi:hypothetical protein
MSWQNAPVLRKLTASEQGGNRGARLWGVDAKGKLYTINQKTPGGEWSNWMGTEGFPANGPKQVYELAACQLANGQCRLWVLDMKREIWAIEQDSPGGNWSHWWHPSRGYWNNAPAAFKKIAASHAAKIAGSLADSPGGAIFIGLKEDGRMAACFNTGTSWTRFRNDWHGNVPYVEITVCQQSDGRLALWAIDEQHQLWGSGEKQAGTMDFGPWAGPNWLGAPKVRNIAAVKGPHGAIVVAQDEQFRVIAKFQTGAGDNWSNWTPANWANAPASYELTAAGQGNGLAQVWAVSLRQKLTSIAQREPNSWPGNWSDDDNDPYPDPPIKANSK